MRLPCGCSRLFRRRRTSLIGLILLFAGSMWMTLLVLQERQEGLEYRTVQQPLPAVDYRVFNSHEKPPSRDGIHTAVGVSSSKNNNTVHRLAQTNGRLPKGLDIALPAPAKYNSSTDLTSPSQHTSPSVHPSHSDTKNSDDVVNDNSLSPPLPPRDTVNVQAKEQVTLDSLPSQIGPDSLQMLRDLMFRLNREQTIRNADKFPPLSQDGVVLIVQVHRREGYLQQLFNSMKNVRGIEKVLLVISHDYYYDDIMKLVQSIDFCRVTQIFYPFSLQAYPDTFPGTSKDDCPRDSTKEEAKAMNCTNADHPDTYGHYREAKITAVKHHWWWKANMVFDGMQETRNFSGYVIFLEEDHYLSPDFLHMTEKLVEMKENVCADCDFINLGMYTTIKSAMSLSHRVSVGVWNAGKNNMGFGMNRKKWEEIKSCKEHFCTYDDYNWDWSINSMGQSCLQRNFKVLVTKAPRIFHIGNCGVHHNKMCNEEADAMKVVKKLDAQKDTLFPDSLHLDSGLSPGVSRKKVKPYGGWGDVRDRELCLSFVGNALRKSL